MAAICIQGSEHIGYTKKVPKSADVCRNYSKLRLAYFRGTAMYSLQLTNIMRKDAV